VSRLRQVDKRRSQRAFRGRAEARLRPDRGVGQTPAGVLAPDRRVRGAAVHGALQVPVVHGHADGRHRRDHNGAAVLLRVLRLDDGVPVRGGVRRARPGVRVRQPPGRRPGPRPTRPMGRRRPADPAVGRALPSGQARPAVQRRVRRADILHHRRSAPLSDIRHERHRLGGGHQRPVRRHVRALHVRARRVHVVVRVVPALVDMLPGRRARGTGDRSHDIKTILL